MEVRPASIELRVAAVDGNRSGDRPNLHIHNTRSLAGTERLKKPPSHGLVWLRRRWEISSAGHSNGHAARRNRQAGQESGTDWTGNAEMYQIFQTAVRAPAYAGMGITISTLAPFRLSEDQNHQQEHRFRRRYRLPGNHRAAMAFELRYGHAPAGPRRHLLKSWAQVPTHRQNRNAVAPRSPAVDPFRSRTCS